MSVAADVGLKYETYHVPIERVVVASVVGVDVPAAVSLFLAIKGMHLPVEWTAGRGFVLVEDHADAVLVARNALTQSAGTV